MIETIRPGSESGRPDIANQTSPDVQSGGEALMDDGDILVEPDVPESDPSEDLIVLNRPKPSKKKPSSISGRKFRKRELVRIDDQRRFSRPAEGSKDQP